MKPLPKEQLDFLLGLLTKDRQMTTENLSYAQSGADEPSLTITERQQWQKNVTNLIARLELITEIKKSLQ